MKLRLNFKTSIKRSRIDKGRKGVWLMSIERVPRRCKCAIIKAATVAKRDRSNYFQLPILKIYYGKRKTVGHLD